MIHYPTKKFLGLLTALSLMSCAAYCDDAQISELINKSIHYLKSEQKKETVENEYYKGEWPSYIYNDEALFMLGPLGKKAYDSNLFVTASIHNSLASLYLKHPEHTEIPEMLVDAVTDFSAYQEKGAFGFWRKFPLEDRFKTKKMLRNHTEVEVRRPSHYTLEGKFVNGAANVPADSDDTAAAFIALQLHQQVLDFGKVPTLDGAKSNHELIGPYFSSFRDRKRMNVHYYNLVYGDHVKTGAFLTWLDKESFLLTGISPKKTFKSYIPYGSNEVDCVVNANVLSALATYGELDTPGVDAACKFINEAVQKKEFNRCGVYYPNRFTFHYAIAKAIKAGATCLNESIPGVIQDLVQQQTTDGNWTSPPPHDKFQNFSDSLNTMMIKKTAKKTPLGPSQPENLTDIDFNDKLQATLYAVNAGIQLGAPADTLQKGMDYLVVHASTDEQNAHWAGGVFFAGGTMIRNQMKWRSDAYTTAIMAETFSDYLDSKKKP